MAQTKINANQARDLIASTNVKNIISLTQADYDLIEVKDTNTLYIIIGA